MLAAKLGNLLDKVLVRVWENLHAYHKRLRHQRFGKLSREHSKNVDRCVIVI